VEDCLVIFQPFKITMKEHEDVALKVGDKVGIEIYRIDSSSGA
jgi:hypothetical protein